jgi:hypothetical protein
MELLPPGNVTRLCSFCNKNESAGVLTGHDGHDMVDLDCCVTCAEAFGVPDTAQRWEADDASGSQESI